MRFCPTETLEQRVPSWDKVPLDVDVTLPAQNTGTRHPLIVMLHGFGNNKHEWESLTDEGDGANKWHWNNRWFAEHGYYVLTYTARGFDNKMGSFIVAEALRLLKDEGGLDPGVGVYAVATVQEEIGLRGARTAAFGIGAQQPFGGIGDGPR